MDIELSLKLKLLAQEFVRAMGETTSETDRSFNTMRQGARAASDDIEVCLVCTDDCEPGDELIVLTCHHSFHADCIKRWLKVNAVCPTCRARVTRVTRRERAALWYSGWVRDDVTDGDGGDGWKEGGDEEIVVNVVS